MAAASALKVAAAAAVCLVLVLSMGQPAAAVFKPTPCADCAKECTTTCDRYAQLAVSWYCSTNQAIGFACGPPCMEEDCQRQKSTIALEFRTKCITGCTGLPNGSCLPS